VLGDNTLALKICWQWLCVEEQWTSWYRGVNVNRFYLLIAFRIV